MAKIQNPENQKGEKLATEINVSESLKNLSDKITSSNYITSSVSNETLPATFEFDINIAANLEDAEENQLADAKAAKAYTDAEVEKETSRATEREDAIESSLNTHGEDIVKHLSSEERNLLENSIKVNYSTDEYLNNGNVYEAVNQAGTSGFQLPYGMLPKGRVLNIEIDNNRANPGNYKLEVVVIKNDNSLTNFLSDNSNYKSWSFQNSKLVIDDNVSYIKCRPAATGTYFNLKKYNIDLGNGAGIGGSAYNTQPSTSIVTETGSNTCLPLVKFESYGPSFKNYVDSLERKSNINNLYDKTDNVIKVSNNTITLAGDSKTKFKPENIISAQYAFRATNTTSSQLTEFNKRTVYAHIDGTIETSTGVDNASQSSATQHCRYEQDLVDQDDEATQSLSTLINGTGMFIRSKLTLFNDDLTCLTNGKSMFASNYELTEFKSPLPSLVYGKGMFTGCRKLTKWRVKLPSLVIANNMFSSTASNEAEYMQLAEVDTCLPNLTIARQMFCGCHNLTKFHVPNTSFSNLYDAQEMFRFTKITSINGNFESLENGDRMFADGPALDAKSVQNIAETIRDWSDGYPGMTGADKPVISLGTLDTSNADIITALDKIKGKGWEVEPDVQQAATLNSDTIGFFARVSYTLSNKTHIDENGNQCSLVLVPTLQWITNKNIWSPMVSSIEEAETHFNLSKIEIPEETI